MSFVGAIEVDANLSSEIDEDIKAVQIAISRESGARGKSEFGEITAVINPGFVALIQEAQHFMS